MTEVFHLDTLKGLEALRILVRMKTLGTQGCAAFLTVLVYVRRLSCAQSVSNQSTICAVQELTRYENLEGLSTHTSFCHHDWARLDTITAWQGALMCYFLALAGQDFFTEIHTLTQLDRHTVEAMVKVSHYLGSIFL